MTLHAGRQSLSQIVKDMDSFLRTNWSFWEADRSQSRHLMFAPWTKQGQRQRQSTYMYWEDETSAFGISLSPLTVASYLHRESSSSNCSSLTVFSMTNLYIYLSIYQFCSWKSTHDEISKSATGNLHLHHNLHCFSRLPWMLKIWIILNICWSSEWVFVTHKFAVTKTNA